MRASQVGSPKKEVVPRDTKAKMTTRHRQVAQPIEVGEDFDWCEWAAMKKSTLTWLRKKAKATSEPKDLTNKKIEAVRAHEPQSGRVAVFSHSLNGCKVWDGVVIKKRGKRPVIEFPKR
jgi:hypothetical protein